MDSKVNYEKLVDFLTNIIKKTAIPAGLYLFLLLIITGVLYFIGFTSVLGSAENFLKITDAKELETLMLSHSVEILLLNTGVSIILHFLMSGIYGMILENNPVFGLGSAFKIIFTKRGLKALIYIIAIQTIVTSINYFFGLIDFNMVGFAIGMILQFLTCFTLVFIYVENKGIFRSIALSTSVVNSKPFFYFWILLVTYIISLSGILLLGIGIIFTLPFSYFMIYCLYLAATGKFTD